MRVSAIVFCVWSLVAYAHCLSTQGLVDLVGRRMPRHANDISFALVPGNHTAGVTNDRYTLVCNNGRVSVEGNSLSALATGLHRYLTDVAHVDIYWLIGSQLDQLQALPSCAPLNGSSIVPWRYHFNTVTFSYTTAFWSWQDWEDELDWLALRGVNLPLAWVGVEKILLEIFQEIGLTQAEITAFFSGPAFQAWNRFGNIQGSWGGQLPVEWIDGQFDLQKQILKRMVELGMTPVLPAFTGFVPRALPHVFPNATVVNISRWEGFSSDYTNDTFLEPSDPLFTQLQKAFIGKQQQYYGNVSNIYTLDQFTENDPISGELDALKQITYNNWQSLKAADPDAVWMLQGWLFFSSIDFWTSERVEAFLSGVTTDSDMLILDLFSESQPQWQRLDSYYGKPWIWCQLHDYGGNHGLYGQVMNLTNNPVEALANSSSLVGFGLTMEGQEGNEIVYDLLLDQAWSGSPIDLSVYFHNWATNRYSNATSGALPDAVYQTWDVLLHTAYNNTNATSQGVTKSIFELSPNATGLLNRTGHHPTTINYDPASLVDAWQLFLSASNSTPSLWSNKAYQLDLIDITRQVLANAFNPLYSSFVAQTNLTTPNPKSITTATTTQTQLLALLSTIDTLLHFTPSKAPESSLQSWIAAARSWTNNTSTTSIADYYAYNAVNQVTLWGPNGEISDYASRSWAGLVGAYYLPRWRMFTDAYLDGLRTALAVNETQLKSRLLSWEEEWQGTLGGGIGTLRSPDGLRGQMEVIVEDWCAVLGC